MPILFIIASIVSVQSFAAPLNCAQGRGVRLCRSIKMVDNLFKKSCQGSACYDLWRSQIQAMKDFSEVISTGIPVGSIFERQVGRLASSAAAGICGGKATGACEWMKALYYAKSEALENLVEIQQGSALHPIQNCKLFYSCP